MLSNISDLFTMASLAICMLLSGIIFYYLRTRINMLEQSVMEQAQLLQQVLRHSQNQQQLLQQQQQQQIATMATASTAATAATATIVPKSLQQQQRLIPVSDDSDSDDSESDDSDSDDSESDYSESDNDSNNLHRSKSIDLSALTSTAQIPLMSSTFFENGGSNTEIKVIELKHYFNGNNDGNCDNSGSGSDNSSESGSDNSSDNSSDGNESGSDDDGNDKGSSNENNNLDNKKHFEKIKKEAHPSLDVPVPLKSMPVNMLRDLAKTKLTHLEQPAINKMSKKEILKALDN
jgi:heme exporter protein D